MKAIVINLHGDLGREVWVFSLLTHWSNPPVIYLDSYKYQARKTTRHRTWQTQTLWDRIDSRQNNIDTPPLDTDVEKRARHWFVSQIERCTINRRAT